MNSFWIPAGLVVYAAVVIWLALKDAQKSSASYINAGRGVGPFATMASVAGNLRDGAGLAAWVILGIFFGFGALWLTFGLCAALLVLAFIAPRIRDLAERRDYVSVQQMLRDGIGPKTAKVAVWVISCTALLYAAAQVFVAGNLFSRALAAPAWVGIAGTCAIVGSYLYLGGYYTTIRTGIVQWFIIMTIVIIPWLVDGGKMIQIEPSSLASPGLAMSLAFFGISFFVVLSSADLWQLIFSATTPKGARNGMALTIPVYIAISVGLVYFAKAVQSVLPTSIAADKAFFEVFSAGILPDSIATVVLLFVIASIMSTLDSQVFLFASTIARELVPKEVSSQDKRMASVSRIILVSTMFILGVIAVTIGNLVEFLFSAVTLGTVLVPPLLLAAWRGMSLGRCDTNDDLGIGLSLAVAIATYVGLFAGGKFANISFTMIPVAVSSLGCFLVLILRKFRAAS